MPVSEATLMRKDRNDKKTGSGGIKRRSFLKVVSASAAGALVFRTGFGPAITERVLAQAATLSKFTEQLPVPGVINLTGGGAYSLSMQPGLHQFHSALPPAPTWGYGGAAYLGPTFETMRGMPVDILATNALGAHPVAGAIDTTLHGTLESDKVSPRATVHLHGGNTEPGSDGGPEQTFLPGASRNFHYHNDQDATTLWYHDHALGITRLNVYAGLAGFYLLRDYRDTGQNGNPLGLPAGPYEIPVVIQDRMFNPDGTLAYPLGAGQVWAPEFFGDVAVVNGKVWPNLNVDRGLYRFRFLNGSNARVYSLRLSNKQSMYQIGTDGGLLNAPVPIGQLILAPGERADVLIDFSLARAGTRILLTNNAPTPFPNGPRNRRKGGAPLKEIMQFTVRNRVGFRGSLPRQLRATPIQRLTPTVVRNLSLVEIMGAQQPLMALLNNLHFNSTQIEKPKVDTVEQWNIINTTGDTHPIHLHLVQFQVLGRQSFNAAAYTAAVYPMLMDPMYAGHGPWPVPSADAYTMGTLKKPEPNELGWKDTVRANPGEITRILVPFGAGAAPGVPIGQSFKGEYVWHCHILEHEDNEMMLKYEVV
jgi:spore coat protein A, manganese oxidase